MAVMTIFEGNVLKADQPALQAKWIDTTRDKPDALLGGWLIQSRDNEDIWCAVHLWKSQDAFTDYQASVEHLPAHLMFRSLGVEPVLAAFEVAEEG